MPPFIVIIGPPEDPKDAFHQVQEEIDRSEWTGRGPNYTLGGGGNTLKEEGPNETDRYDR